MKIKLYEVLDMQKTFTDLSEMKVPSRLQYWIMRNNRWVKEHAAFIYNEQYKFMQEHLNQSEDGVWGKVDENGIINLNYKSTDDMEKYNFNMDNLSNMEIDIEPYILNYEKVIEENPSFELESKYLILLDRLIE